MSSLSQWIIVILVHQIVLNSKCVLSGDADGEHVHIKVHIPEVRRKHTHFRKVQKHIFHPKKVVKSPDYLDTDLETINKPINVMSYSMTAQPMQFPPLSIGIGNNLPDIPTYAVDNTLESTIIKKPRINSMSHMISEDMFTKFHGMKKASEFLGARPVTEMQRFSSAGIEDDNVEELFADDYDTHSTESMLIDQRIAGSMYPNSVTMESPFKHKWQAATYSNVYEPAAKPFLKWPSWLSSTTEDDLTAYEKFPSSTTMYISKARPISGSSRPRYERHEFDETPFESETWVVPKKKRSKLEKRKRTHSPGFRINY